MIQHRAAHMGWLLIEGTFPKGVPRSDPSLLVALPVKVWEDDESWYAEVVTVPQAHVCAASRGEALQAIQHVIADLKAHGLWHESAELASVEA